MSFRLKIVFMTMMLITLLFSTGGSLLVHSSFQNALQKEEETLVDTNEMMLRVVAYVGRDGTWVTEEKLISVIENLCQQDELHSLQLLHEGEVVYSYQNNAVVLPARVANADLKENQVRISYFESEQRENYLQSSMKFLLNGKTYCLNICRKLSDIYETRVEQLQLVQVIFLLMALIGMCLSWLLATYLTKNLRELTKAS